MHVPKIGFKWDFSIGNVISLVLMVAGAVAAWYALEDKADIGRDAALKIPTIEQRIAVAEQNLAMLNQTIEVGRTARLTFQASVVETFKTIEADRREQSDVNAEVLAQLRVIVARLDSQARADLSSEYRGPFAEAYERALARAYETM